VVWLGFGIIWAGYATGLYGYSLVRGYNLTLAQMVSPVKWYQGKWPPAEAGNTQILPSGTAAGIQTTALQVANAPAGTAATGAGGAAAPRTSATVANTATIRAAAAVHGWGKGGQWNALTHLIAAESGGNTGATNPSSGAYGIAQALGHGTSCSSGSHGNNYGPQYGLSCAQARAANSGNAAQQLRWMMGYIKSRYGSPAAAWQHETANNWY
jgi:hypothetical protein